MGSCWKQKSQNQPGRLLKRQTPVTQNEISVQLKRRFRCNTVRASASEDGTLDRKSFNGCAAEAFTRLRSLVNILGGGSAGQGRTPSYSEPKVIFTDGD